jgi:hypothetical protein
LIGIGLSSSDFSGFGSAGAGAAGVSHVVLDVDVGGWRRASFEESMGIVSIASGDNASGRDWDWDWEAGSGVDMVGVDAILEHFVAILRGVDVEEWVVVEYGVEGFDIEITWGYSYLSNLYGSCFPHPRSPRYLIGATWRGCNQRQRKKKQRTPHLSCLSVTPQQTKISRLEKSLNFFFYTVHIRRR